MAKAKKVLYTAAIAAMSLGAPAMLMTSCTNDDMEEVISNHKLKITDKDFYEDINLSQYDLYAAKNIEIIINDLPNVGHALRGVLNSTRFASHSKNKDVSLKLNIGNSPFEFKGFDGFHDFINFAYCVTLASDRSLNGYNFDYDGRVFNGQGKGKKIYLDPSAKFDFSISTKKIDISNLAYYHGSGSLDLMVDMIHVLTANGVTVDIGDKWPRLEQALKSTPNPYLKTARADIKSPKKMDITFAQAMALSKTKEFSA